MRYVVENKVYLQQISISDILTRHSRD